MPDPLHRSERNFRRYEKVIKRICDTYPSPFVFRPVGLSAETVCSRLRDAIAYYLVSRWESEISRMKLAEVRAKFVFTQDGIRVKAALPDPLKFDFQDLGNAKSTAFVENPTLDELLAFALLITNKRIKLQVIFQNVSRQISSAAETALESNPLIQFFPDGKEWVML